MSKKSSYTTVTPIPPGVSRQIVMDTLRNHVEMIDLNPLVIDRTPCKPPPFASSEEYHSIWYAITDKIAYLPGASSKVTYHGCFHDLPNGLQTHCFAPLGLEIKGKWTVGGNESGEPAEAVELGLGIPRTGLYLREDVELKCNIMMTGFVKKTTKKAHSSLVERLVEKGKIMSVNSSNAHMSTYSSPGQSFVSPAQSYASPALSYAAPTSSGEYGQIPVGYAGSQQQLHRQSTTQSMQVPMTYAQLQQYQAPPQGTMFELPGQQTPQQAHPPNNAFSRPLSVPPPTPPKDEPRKNAQVSELPA